MTTIVRLTRRPGRRLPTRPDRIDPAGRLREVADGVRPRRAAAARRLVPTWRRVLQVRLALADTLVIALTVGLAIGLSGSGVSLVPGSPQPVLWGAAVGVIWVLALLGSGAYAIERLGAGFAEYRAVATGAAVLVGVLAVFSVLADVPLDRTLLLGLLLGGLVVLPGARVILRRSIRRSRARGGLSDRAVVVGSPEAVDRVARRLRAAPQAGFRVRAVATGEQDAGWFHLQDDTRVLQWGRPESVVPALRAGQADVVVVADQESISPALSQDLARALDDTGARLVFVQPLEGVSAERTRRQRVNGLTLDSVATSRFVGPRYRIKRVFDILGAGLLIVALTPLLAGIALAVLIESGRPLFFFQKRVGTDGRPFVMTKFRSMVTDAEALKADLVSDSADGNFKKHDDPRCTRVGRVLRRWSIDELPQLFDVLRGDMSLVGPRPALPEEVAAYPVLATRRLRVKPGLTGESQVSGRSDLAWEESVRYDVAYVENWSVRGDLGILARTVRAVVSGKGAY